MPYGDVSTKRNEPIAARLERLNAELRDASAQTVLRVAMIREWPESLTYVSSFGAESVAMLALIADVNPDLPIIFLETGMHFPQTLDYKEELIERLGLTGVRDIPPSETERKILDPKNTLWKSDSDACCALRKVRPLEPALDGFDAWITGRKRFHGGARMSLPVFEYAGDRFKVNPLANWTPEDVNLLIEQRDLPRHPLVDQGYPSIGCWPCTRPSDNPDDPRAGRWVGQNKSECGLHIDKAERPRVF